MLSTDPKDEKEQNKDIRTPGNSKGGGFASGKDMDEQEDSDDEKTPHW